MKRKWLILNIANAVLLLILLYLAVWLSAKGSELTGKTFQIIWGLLFGTGAAALRASWFVLDSRLRTKITPFQEAAVKGALILVMAAPWIGLYTIGPKLAGDMGTHYRTSGMSFELLVIAYLLIQCIWSLVSGIRKRGGTL